VLGRWGFLFLNKFGCVSPEIGLTFCYELVGQRWIEGKIDLSSSGTGPLIDHGAYSTLTEFILLKRNVKSSFSCCIFLVWKFQNVVYNDLKAFLFWSCTILAISACLTICLHV
jgi:hypothetical protein